MEFVTGKINFGAVVERKLAIIMREKNFTRDEAVIFCIEKVCTPCVALNRTSK